MNATEREPDRERAGGGSKLGYHLKPRADEAALWTLVGGVGQLVLAGWCLAMASLVLLLGIGQLRSYGDLPSWTSGVLAVIFIGIGAVLLYVGVRFLAQSIACFWAAWRKTWFMISYYRNPDPTRAMQAAEGDPLLEPYVRHLLKRGALRFTDSSPEDS